MKYHLNGMKITSDNLVSFHKSMSFAQRLLTFLDGVLNHLLKDGRVRKLFLCSRWDMKFSLVVGNYSPPRYPGLKVTASLPEESFRIKSAKNGHFLAGHCTFGIRRMEI